MSWSNFKGTCGAISKPSWNSSGRRRWIEGHAKFLHLRYVIRSWVLNSKRKQKLIKVNYNLQTMLLRMGPFSHMIVPTLPIFWDASIESIVSHEQHLSPPLYPDVDSLYLSAARRNARDLWIVGTLYLGSHINILYIDSTSTFQPGVRKSLVG